MHQEKKPLYTSIAAAVLVLLVGFVIYGRLGSNTAVIQKGDEQATSTLATSTVATSTSGSLPMEVASISSSTSLYAVRAEYPRFPSSPALTAQIESYIAAQTSQFARSARDNDQAAKDALAPGERPTDFQYSMDIAWEPAQLNGRFVSFALRTYAFEGGADGRQEIETFNWDMRRQQEVTLASLFPNDPAYLQRVSAYTRQVLKSTMGSNANDEFLNDGTKPALASFQSFTFSDQAVTLLFPKYQVAAGAAGEQKVVMPRDVQGLF